MRILSVLLLFTLFSTNVAAQNNDNMQLLKESLKELQKSPNDSIKQRHYFDAFPKNFPDLLVTLGYTSFSDPLPDYEDYISAFRNLTFVSEDEKMVRLSHLMLGGFWQADGVNFTFDMMKDFMEKNPDRAFHIISKLTDCQQVLFWQCYWQNPCEDPSLEKDFHLFYSTPGYNRERQVMKAAYESFKGELPVM